MNNKGPEQIAQIHKLIRAFTASIMCIAYPESILHKSIVGRYRFIKNASRAVF